MAWISVEDRLPEADGRYLVYTLSDGVEIAWHLGGHWSLSGVWGDWDDTEVTHWQALPSSPDVPETPSSERLRELAKKHPPSQEGYEEELPNDLTNPEEAQ